MVSHKKFGKGNSAESITPKLQETFSAFITPNSEEHFKKRKFYGEFSDQSALQIIKFASHFGIVRNQYACVSDLNVAK